MSKKNKEFYCYSSEVGENDKCSKQCHVCLEEQVVEEIENEQEEKNKKANS